jgi:hypothetical protein
MKYVDGRIDRRTNAYMIMRLCYTLRAKYA